MMLNPIRPSASGRAPSRVGRARAGQDQTDPIAAAGARSGAQTSAAAPVAPVASLDALMALQSVEAPAERRARAARRGMTILDDLDALKLAILEGRVGPGDIERLRRLVESARGLSGDAELDTLIGHIELRAEVEIAKLGG